MVRPISHKLIDDMRRYPLLTKPQQEEAIAGLLAGDKQAREQLICANTRLAVKLAKEYERSGLPFEDLVGAAMVGLIKGVDKFKPTGGSKLTYFLGIFIRGEILRVITANKCLVKIGTTTAQQKCMFKLASGAEHNIVAAELGVAEAYVNEIAGRISGEVSLDNHWGGSNEERIVDSLASDAPTALELVAKKEEATLVNAAVNSLDEVRQAIITRHVMNEEPLRLVAKDLGIKLKCAQEMLAMALATLRATLTEEVSQC
jgi:RNA polymerase sigma factor (sigma-70 family)